MMNNVGINNTNFNRYSYQPPRIQNKEQNLQNVIYPYPVYNEVPYGINKTNYIKIGVQKLPSGDDLHTYILPTGQKIGIVKTVSGCPIIYNYIDTGAFDEPDGKEGMSHLIEHSIYHASKNYPDGVEEYINTIGGYSNAHTTGCETCYYIKLNDSANLDKALEVSADMIYNPLFSKLQKEKPVVISEAEKVSASEITNIVRHIDKDLLSVSKPDVMNPIAGTIQSVNSITREDMLEYHKKHYVPANITTVVLSDKEPDEIINSVADKFYEASKDKINMRQFKGLKGLILFQKSLQENRLK